MTDNQVYAAQSRDTVVVNELPKFDLTSYISNYTGRTVIRRLYLIGVCCPPLREEAAKLAVREAKRGNDVDNFHDAVNLLQSVPDYRDAENLLDTSWAADQEKRNAKETQRLENELKGYKNNLIKESIRMGNQELGQHYHKIGDLPSAAKAFARMRDYCTVPSHISETAFSIIDVAVEQRNWMAVQSQVIKVTNLQMKADDASKHSLRVAALSGLQRMSNGEYKEAAKLSFLKCDPTMGDQINNIISANDVAVYGGLCALASMSRNELQAEVLDNASFRNFLELEPHIRRATSFFVACKYTQCLEILESHRNDYLLDLYLQPHVDKIYRQIREKSIVQYFEPFGSVRLENMEKVFGQAALKTNTDTSSTNGATQVSVALLDELVALIETEKLNARLDLEKNLLVAVQAAPRLETYKEAEATLDKFTKDAYLKLLRLNLSHCGIEVKAPPSKKKGAVTDWDDDDGGYTNMAPNGKSAGHTLGGGGGLGGGRSLRSGR